MPNSAVIAMTDDCELHVTSQRRGVRRCQDEGRGNDHEYVYKFEFGVTRGGSVVGTYEGWTGSPGGAEMLAVFADRIARFAAEY